MKNIIIALPLCAALISGQVLADKLYRYRNTDGNLVVDYRVPAEYVGSGYEIINEEGVVLDIVPRELTPQERELAEIQRLKDEAARAEEERLKAWDESLLLRYSTIQDIEAARERALDNLRIRLSILKGNRRSLKQKVENFQAQAAELERAGKTVDDKRLQSMRDMQSEINATERSIADREREIQEVSAAFQLDIDRFEELQDMVEMRRVHAENEASANSTKR